MKRNNSIEQLLLAVLPPAPPPKPTSSSSESDGEEEEEGVGIVVEDEEPPPTWNNRTGGNTGSGNRKRLLSKQLSMRETTREANWEKRRRQILLRRVDITMEEGAGRSIGAKDDDDDDDCEEEDIETMEEEAGSEATSRQRRRVRSLTDEDLDELRGSIELGFGFNEEDGGHNLCETLPALDLYFAVNRQLSDPKIRLLSLSPVSTPSATSSASTICGTPSPRSPNHSSPTDYWKICNPGDNPQHVKTRLRHWAQAVACSVRQCC